MFSRTIPNKVFLIRTHIAYGMILIVPNESVLANTTNSSKMTVDGVPAWARTISYASTRMHPHPQNLL